MEDGCDRRPRYFYMGSKKPAYWVKHRRGSCGVPGQGKVRGGKRSTSCLATASPPGAAATPTFSLTATVALPTAGASACKSPLVSQLSFAILPGDHCARFALLHRDLPGCIRVFRPPPRRCYRALCAFTVSSWSLQHHRRALAPTLTCDMRRLFNLTN